MNDGKLRALAVGGKNRVRELPQIPTMREVGFAKVECDASISRLVGLGFEPFTATPEEVAALIKSELPKWAGVIRAAGIKPN